MLPLSREFLAVAAGTRYFEWGYYCPLDPGLKDYFRQRVCAAMSRFNLFSSVQVFGRVLLTSAGCLLMLAGFAIADPPLPATSTDKTPAAENAAPQTSATASSELGFPIGQWVNILPLVDADRNAVNGTWAVKAAELVGEPVDRGRIELPVIIDGGYDLEVEFTRAAVLATSLRFSQ